jgi:TonB-dependent starch-binding outer membrane protein SusC
MKITLLKSFLLVGALLCFGLVGAQTVSGNVSDANGPLPGATVIIKGTSVGTSADFDGNYSIAAKTGDILVFSYVGYKSQEINYGNQSSLNVVLEMSNQLDEVIITGYGSVTKRDATGAVDALDSKNFDVIGSDSPAQLLRGKVSGVQVTSSTGEPGAGVSIRVRGNTSVRSGNEPLIVVDGIPLAGGNTSSGGADFGYGGSSAKNPLNFINQNDIESISVLKDASSTAIYGARGANGVIVITTKRAKSGDASVSYAGSVGISSFAQNSSYNDVMTADEYKNNLPPETVSAIANGIGNYKWQDVIFQTGLTTNHDFTISKTGTNSATRLSIGANIQDGIVKKTGMDKYNISFFNSNGLFEDKLNVQTRVLFSSIEDQRGLLTNNAGYQGNLLGSALYWRPNMNTKANQNYTFIGDDYINPEHLLDAYDSNTTTNRILTSVTASLNINDKLSYKNLFAIDNSVSNAEAQMLPTITLRELNVDGKGGIAVINYDNRLNKTWESTLNYVDNKGDLGIDLLGGYSYYSYYAEGNSFSAEGFNKDQTNLINNLEGNVGKAESYRVGSYANEFEIQSLFARAAITYNKLLATLTYRLDGSSKFGEGKKYGSFPSLGIGYKLIEDQSGVLNNIKLRTNWGVTGNQEFAVNSAISKSRYFGGSISTVTNANPNLEWETTVSYGAGIDFALLDQRLTGSVDYFMKNTENLIFPLPESATKPGPASPRFVNLPGNLINSGFEIGLSYDVISTEDITWSLSGNSSFISNEMQDFGGFIQTGGINGQGLTGAYAQVLTNNQPLYTYYLFEFRGYDQNGASLYTQADGSIGALGSAAKVLFEDYQALPKVNAGISTNIRYKDFDLSTSLYGAFGHYIYNNTANALFFRGAYPVRNIPLSVIESGQAATDPNSPSTKFLEKGDFLRWNNLTLGYTLESSLLEKINASSARVSLSANNLATFTNYSGFDPEVDVDKSLGGVPSTGMDYLSYPRSRTFTLGVNLTF